MRNQTIRIGTRVAIKSYNRFPRHWRYTQKIYSGKVAIVEKTEFDSVNNIYGYRINLDNGAHRWLAKDFAAVNVSAEYMAPQAQPTIVESVELPTRCMKCNSTQLDFNGAELEVHGLNEVYKIGFCDNCGANIILKFKFYAAAAIPI